nr:MAG TPA: hypothetical protein [Caudoviricetes sp.]
MLCIGSLSYTLKISFKYRTISSSSPLCVKMFGTRGGNYYLCYSFL